MIQVGNNMFMKLEHLKLAFEQLDEKTQILYWSKNISDCTDDEFICGLTKFSNKTTIQPV